MDQRFKGTNLKTLVIEASSSTRAILTETLRDQGQTDITGMTSVKDALGILEVEPVDWIITTSFTKDPVSVFHLLDLITNHGTLLATRVSLLISDEEKELLPSAYSLGLMSHHPVIITKEVLAGEWKNLFSKFAEHNYNLAFVAADFLGRHLKDIDDHGLALRLYTKLWETFPEQFELLEQALPHIQELGRDDQLKATLKKLKMIYGEAEKAKWQELRDTYLPAQDVETDDELETEASGMGAVVVVDPDETLHSIYEEIFTSFGAASCHVFSDGGVALEHLENNPNPEIILQEWRLPTTTGPLFLQKAIAKGGIESQFIVHSSLVTGHDVPLVQELGVAKVVDKPLERSRLVKAIVQTLRQHNDPKEQIALARKVRFALRKRDLTEARACLSEYQQGTEQSASQGNAEGLILAAECELLAGEAERAKELAMAAIKAGGSSLEVLNVLGKALFAMGDYPLALTCYAKAQDISPMNFRRLCDIAEIQSSIGEEQEADAAIEKAKDITGEGDPEVAAAEAKVAVNSGDAEAAKSLLSQLDSLEAIVATLNNQAVALARFGKFDESYAQYQKTIDSIPDERGDIKAAIQYNLGLAYTRADRYDEAVKALEPLSELTSKVGAKAKSLATRVSAAIEGGTKVVLAGSSSEGSTDESAKKSEKDRNDVTGLLRIKSGSLCCFKIFNLDEPHPKVAEFLEQMPRFNSRQSFKSPTDDEDKAQAS